MAFVVNPLSLSIPPSSFETWLRENGHLEVLDKCAVDPSRSSRGILSYIRGFAVNPFGNITFEDLCRPPVPWTGQFWDCGHGFFDSYGLPLSGTQLKLRMSENMKRYMGNYLRLFLIILACFIYKMPVTFGGLIIVVALWEGIRQLLNYFNLQRDSFFHQALLFFGKIVTAVIMFYCKVALSVCWAGVFSFAVMVLHSSLRKITPSKAPPKVSIKMEKKQR